MTLAPISLIGSGSSSARSRSRAPIRMWWLHLGQTLRLRSSSARYSTASQAGHLIQRPSGTERERRSVLMRDGTIFSNHDMRLHDSRIGGKPELGRVIDPPEVQPRGCGGRLPQAALAALDLLPGPLWRHAPDADRQQ